MPEPKFEGQNQEEEIIRNIDLYNLMEKVYTFSGGELFDPIRQGLMGIPESENMGTAERFEGVEEENMENMKTVGISLKLERPEDEEKLSEITVHISNPDNFSKYLKSVDGKMLTPSQAVGLAELAAKLRSNLHPLLFTGESPYDAAKPNEDFFNYLKVLPSVQTEFMRIYEEIKSNEYAKYNGEYFETNGNSFFYVPSENENERPDWHLGEDFNWQDFEYEAKRAGNILKAANGRYLREFLELEYSGFTPQQIVGRGLDFSRYEEYLDEIQKALSNPSAGSFVKEIVATLREQIPAKYRPKGLSDEFLTALYGKDKKRIDEAKKESVKNVKKENWQLDEFLKGLDSIEKEVGKK